VLVKFVCLKCGDCTAHSGEHVVEVLNSEHDFVVNSHHAYIRL
jgi:hypothetical protein